MIAVYLREQGSPATQPHIVEPGLVLSVLILLSGTRPTYYEHVRILEYMTRIDELCSQLPVTADAMKPFGAFDDAEEGGFFCNEGWNHARVGRGFYM